MSPQHKEGALEKGANGFLLATVPSRDASSVCMMLILACLYCKMWISFLSGSNSEQFADLEIGISCYAVQRNGPSM